MNLITPVRLTDAMLLASSVPENDYPEWSAAAVYAQGDRVIIEALHSVFESVADQNTGNAPADGVGVTWLHVGSTNRWRAFDLKTGQATSQNSNISYRIALDRVCTGVAFIGLSAKSVRVRVYDSGTVTYDNLVSLVDGSPIDSLFSYFTYAPEYVETLVLDNIPAYTGNELEIIINGVGGSADVGEIVFGRSVSLGSTLGGTEIGFEDLSLITRDDFGGVSVVERDFYGTVSFQFAIPVGGEGRVRSLIAGVRATPALFYASARLSRRGTTIFGLAQPLRLPLSVAGVSTATLEVEEMR